jgi:hypothetical protein
MILDIIVRLRVWTAWSEQLCARGALREQHRGGRCVASPITIGRVPDLQRGSALPADAGGSDAWPCMQSVVDPRRECSCILLRVGRACGQVLGFGPRNRHGWMEELSTGRKRGVRAWRDMASDMDGFPLCVGRGSVVRLPVTRFRFSISLLDLPSSGTSWQVRTPRRLPPTRAPCDVRQLCL